jgi:transposase InsO family protein
MIVPLLLSIKSKQDEHGIFLERFYEYVGISRQGFSKAFHVFERERLMIEKISALVKNYRQKKDRRAGSRSLYYNVDIKDQFGMGVNKFEQLMSEHGLTLAPMSVRVITTRSSLQSWNYSNLVNGLLINNINQVVVGDLTYITLFGKRYYLFCLTDLYSARIVGIGFGSMMRAKEAKQARDEWVKLRRKKNLRGCIHHTDGGAQYFSGLYLKSITEMDVQISCAENCLMNGYAEQRNGLIKHHLIPTIRDFHGDELRKEIKRIIRFYNYERKQESLGWMSPVEYERKIVGMENTPTLELHKYVD